MGTVSTARRVTHDASHSVPLEALCNVPHKCNTYLLINAGIM